MMAEKHNDFIPTRQSLLSRLKSWDDRESWRDFFDTYGRLIYGLAIKCGLTDAEAQDAVQETLLSVAKQMPGFKYDPSHGSFKGWLLRITRRRIADQFRRRPPQPYHQHDDGDRTATIERVPEPASLDLDAVWEEEWQKGLLERALARVKRRVSTRQYQIFDLYVSQQRPMQVVTSTLGVNPAQVYMAKLRVSRLLKKEVQRLQSETG